MLNMIKTHEKQNTNVLKIVVVYIFLQEHNIVVLFYQCWQIAQLCGTKTIFLSEINIHWIFFIQFYYARSHIEHRWKCSYITQNRQKIRILKDVCIHGWGTTIKTTTPFCLVF
jgi:hypothetical protein